MANIQKGVRRIGWVALLAWEAVALSVAAREGWTFWKSQWWAKGLPLERTIDHFLAVVGPGLMLAVVAPVAIMLIVRAITWVIEGFTGGASGSRAPAH